MHIFCFKQSFQLYHDNMGYQKKFRGSESWDLLRCHEFLGGFCEDGRWLSQDLDQRFWGEKSLGHMVFRWNGREGGGVNHRQRSVGLFRLTSLSNSRKRRHQKSFQEVHFTLWDSFSLLIIQPWVHALKYPIVKYIWPYGTANRGRVNIFFERSPKQSHETFEMSNKVPNNKTPWFGYVDSLIVRYLRFRKYVRLFVSSWSKDIVFKSSLFRMRTYYLVAYLSAENVRLLIFSREEA